MKNIFLLICLISTTLMFSQASSKLNNAQNTYSTGQPRVIVSTDTLPSGLWRTYPKPLVTWNWTQVTNTPTTRAGYGITDAYPLSGNPSGFLTSITSSQITTALGYTPYNSSNPNSYISGINSGMVIGALGYNPVNPNGTNLQYIAGDGSKITFPSIPASQVNSDWNSSSGVSQILNKPIIPTDNSQLTNGMGFITASSIDNLTNKSGNISQWTNNSGYVTSSSTNIFTNKSGNISQWSNDTGYLTGITSGQVTTALGFTPYNSTNPNSYINQSGARTAISLTTTGTSGASTYNNSTGVFNIPNYSNTDYTNTTAVAGGAGNVIFYLTNDKTSTGTALYSTVNYVNPVVNDSTTNYTYGWSYNAGTKALTVNVKQATGINVALVGLTLLGVPANVANGTSVQVLVKGN